MACALLYKRRAVLPHIIYCNIIIKCYDSINIIIFPLKFSPSTVFHLLLWTIGSCHMWFKVTCYTLCLNEGGMSTPSLSVSIDVRHFRLFSSEPIRKTERWHCDYKPLLCLFFLEPLGGSYKSAGLSKNHAAKHHFNILPIWAHHYSIMPLTKIFKDVLMKAASSIFSVAYTLT